MSKIIDAGANFERLLRHFCVKKTPGCGCDDYLLCWGPKKDIPGEQKNKWGLHLVMAESLNMVSVAKIRSEPGGPRDLERIERDEE